MNSDHQTCASPSAGNASARMDKGPRTMWGAAWLITAVFMLSNSATPLYVQWQQQIGFASTTLTLIFAAYILGLILTLLVAGQLSDRFGRRIIIIPGIAAAIVAAVLFCTAAAVVNLLIARFLTGIAVGVIVSAGMASVVDFGGPQRQKQASYVASVSMVIGAGLGPLLAGALAQTLRTPILLIFILELIVLVSALLVAMRLPFKTQQSLSDRSWHLRLPSVVREYRHHVGFGIAVFGPGITATSFVLSLGPSLLSHLLDVRSPLIAGGMACAMFLTATGVQFAVRSLSVRTVFLLGSGAVIVSMTGMVLAVNFELAGVLVASALFAGAAQGLGQLGGLTLIGLYIPAARRAEANSVLNLGGYIPAGLLPVLTGMLIDRAGLAAGAGTFAVVLGLSGVAGLITVWFRHER